VFAGFAAGLLALQTHPTPLAGGAPQQPWTGIPTAAIGFGLIVAAVIGGEGAREYFATAGFSWRQPAALIITIPAVLAPLGAAAWWASRGIGAPLQRASADFRPAVVSVQALTNDQPRALILGSGSQTAVGYGVVRGNGSMLGDADYAVPTATTARLNDLVGGLLSDSGGNLLPQLTTEGIRYVVATKSLPAEYVRTLDGTPGLTRLSGIAGTDLWEIQGTAARLTLRAAPQPAPVPGAKPPAPVPGAKTPTPVPGAKTPTPVPGAKTPTPTPTPPTPDPNVLKIDSIGVRDAKAEVPPAPADGRTLVLAENYDPNWTATLNGADLKPVKVDDWAQGFQIPAAGGTFSLSYSSGSRDAWLIGEALFFMFAIVMALPTGRRVEDADHPVDDFVPPSPSGGSSGRRRAAPVEPEVEYEPEFQAEYEPEYQAEYQPEAAYESGYADEYVADEYVADEYVAETYETATYETATYETATYEAEPEYAYEPETAPEVGRGRRRATGEFERPDFYAEPDRNPRHGSGEYERPNLDEYEGYEGGYR
jgi:hypothetical protein